MALTIDSQAWTKSSKSVESECVEVQRGTNVVTIRDSKDPSGPTIAVSEEAWAGFISAVRG